MDYQAAQFWMNALALICGAGAALYTWISNRQRATAKDVSDLEERVTRLEAEVGGLPGHGHLSEIHEKVNAAATAIAKIDGTLGGIGSQLNLITEFLLKQGEKK